MLVAQKQQYQEQYYPPVVEKEQPKLEPRSRVVSKPKIKPRRKFLHFVMVLIGFGICSYTIARYAMIAQNQQEILDLEKALEKQQSIQEYMKLELTARGDLERIEEFAKNNLDMDYPDNEQILFVELPKMDTKEVADASTSTDQKENLWSKIIGLLD